ncbi:MAG: peroxiredoxin [Myxococcota bacterium]|jgi:peroxiredoxin
MRALILTLSLAACAANQAAPTPVSAVAPAPAATPAPAAPVADVATVGAPAPDFALLSVDGAEVKLSDYAGKTVVLEWFNPGCPFVKDVHGTGKMGEIAGEWVSDEVVWVAINSGAPGKQGTGLEKNQEARTEWNLSYPVLLDESGTVGQKYGAKTTPHMYVVAPDGNLAYAGAFSNAPMGRVDGDVEVNYVAAALGDLAAGRAVGTSSAKPWGCSVKY